MGEVFRRVVGKALLLEVREKVSEAVGRFQFGVGAQGGAQRVAHLMRRLCAARDNDTDFTVCKVDMHNAFNSACRQAMLDALVNRGLPELVPWMSWLMKNTSKTLSMLAERFGVDPALLRSANVGVPLPEADDVDVSQSVHSIIVPSGAKGDVATIGLEGNLWYLDDGILCGPSSAVIRAFEHFRPGRRRSG